MDTTSDHDQAGTGEPGPGPGPDHHEFARSPMTEPRPPAGPRLHRAVRGRMLAGVAAGVADYFDVDPTLVRVAFAVLAVLGGMAVPLYLAGWLLIPDEETDVSLAEELLARERTRGAY